MNCSGIPDTSAMQGVEDITLPGGLNLCEDDVLVCSDDDWQLIPLDHSPQGHLQVTLQPAQQDSFTLCSTPQLPELKGQSFDCALCYYQGQALYSWVQPAILSQEAQCKAWRPFCILLAAVVLCMLVYVNDSVFCGRQW